MRNIRIITAVALLSAAVSAFADGGKLSYNDMRRYNYFFLEAVNQEAAGNLSAAYDLLEHARQINPEAAEVYYNLAATM